jgi:hypothetical protein
MKLTLIALMLAAVALVIDTFLLFLVFSSLITDVYRQFPKQMVQPIPPILSTIMISEHLVFLVVEWDAECAV